MSDLADILTKMSQDIDSLKEWRKSVEGRNAADEAETSETLRMFNEYITERNAKEEKEARDLQALREMMM